MSPSALGNVLRRVRRAVLAGGFTFLLGATSLAGPLAPVTRVASADVLQAPSPLALEMAVFSLVNADRAAGGLAPLTIDPALVAVARWRSDDMAVQDYFSHDIGGVAGDTVFRVLREQSVTYRTAGENLARTYATPDQSPTLIEAALMDSPTHHANIMYPAYTHLGVGVAIAPDGRTLYTQLFRQALPFVAAADSIILLS
jgi:uncharacterized protein YkwD